MAAHGCGLSAAMHDEPASRIALKGLRKHEPSTRAACKHNSAASVTPPTSPAAHLSSPCTIWPPPLPAAAPHLPTALHGPPSDSSEAVREHLVVLH